MLSKRTYASNDNGSTGQPATGHRGNVRRFPAHWAKPSGAHPFTRFASLTQRSSWPDLPAVDAWVVDERELLALLGPDSKAHHFVAVHASGLGPAA
jgi:hypothetical protein